MAISNFGELKSAIIKESHRSDMSTDVADIVLRCNSKLNRILRCREMETILTPSITASPYALPSNYLETISVRDTGNFSELKEYLPQQTETFYPTSGNPQKYAIIGSNMYFYPTPSVSAPLNVSIIYYASLANFSLDADTNWLLTKHPDAYLYGSMIEVSSLFSTPELLAMRPGWVEGFAEVLRQIQGETDRRLWNSPPLSIGIDSSMVI